ncbi:hypothetical protein PR003_g23800 [Phytophthora rubi]|uniref:Uncharacterized protein n=1 Tax=Phytophthora rubi TaxID=129364 RepID=A0A6A4CSF2_9STRA|nr:hypothetical protein PR003_g23800 [Phytophthora rubi]
MTAEEKPPAPAKTRAAAKATLPYQQSATTRNIAAPAKPKVPRKPRAAG